MKLPDNSDISRVLIAERLVGVDLLRGIAVLFVVFNHIPHYAMGGFRQNPFFFPAMMMDYGYLGVPLFVLISGFCIHRRAAIAELTHGSQTLNWLEFWKRRFWRLYPPYLAAMVISVTAAVLIYWKNTPNLDTLFWDTVSHVLMVHNLTAEYGGGMGNGAFWSLGMEEQLYLLYVPLFFFFKNSRRGIALLVATMATIAWRSLSAAACTIDAHSTLPHAWLGLGSWGMWPFSYWLHWTLGAIAVDAYFGNCRLPKWCSSLTVAIAVGCIGGLTNRIFLEFIERTKVGSIFEPIAAFGPRFNNLSELIFALAFFCLLNWCVKTKSKHALLQNAGSKLLAQVGRISYSVYLIHIPVIYSLEVILPFKHSVADWILRLTIYLATSLLASVLFYQVVEKWFIHGRNPFSKTKNLTKET